MTAAADMQKMLNKVDKINKQILTGTVISFSRIVLHVTFEQHNTLDWVKLKFGTH